MLYFLVISISVLVLISFLFSLTHTKIQCLISFHKNRRRLLDWYTELVSSSPSQTTVVHRGLGSRRTIVTANPSNVEYILKTNFANFPKGKPFTEILGDLLGVGIFNADGELWSTQRKLASHEFTTRSLRDLVVSALEREVGDKLIPMLDAAVESSAAVDLQEALKRLAFDVVCRVSLGIDTCRVDLSSLVAAFDRAAEISAGRGAASVVLAWKAKRLLRVGSERLLREAIETIHRSVDQIIRDKRDELSRRPPAETIRSSSGGGDLLTRLLMAGHGEEVVRDMAISFIMAGRDTTSSAMTWLFWLLSENSDAERLLVKEVSDVINKNNNNNINNNKKLGYEDLQEMRYVRACLCESMRLYPPVPWDSKHAASDDVLPDGTAVAAGDRVTYFPYGMGRIEEIWGKDCLEFKPTRWLVETGSGLRPVNPFKFPVFQAGPRVCLGKEMAFTQMKYVVAAVLSRFELQRVGSDRPVFVPLLTGHMAGGLRVLVKRRIICGR